MHEHAIWKARVVRAVNLPWSNNNRGVGISNVVACLLVRDGGCDAR